jgi:hypothetical protein
MSWPSDRFGLRWRRPLPLVFLGLSVRPASPPNDPAAVRVNLRAAMAEIERPRGIDGRKSRLQA